MARPHLADVRRLVGIVFQDPDDQLFLPTVRDDVAFGPANLGLRGAALERRVAELVAWPAVPAVDPKAEKAERTAINTVVQGSAADLIKLAMVDLHKHFAATTQDEFFGVARGEDRRVLMLLQIHDELVFEAPEDLAESVRDTVVRRMEQAMTLRVPLKADAHIGRNWFESK